MGFSIRQTIRAFAYPEHKLSCSKRLWEQIRRELAERGGGIRESGAFLLGNTDRAGRKAIWDFVPYDDLDPNCLDSGIIEFNGTLGFPKLFALCRERKLEVVADVHTHPGLPFQSQLDRDHPMMACIGHLALIVPNFAQTPIPIDKLGFYRYLGSSQWEDWSGKDARQRFLVGL